MKDMRYTFRYTTLCSSYFVGMVEYSDALFTREEALAQIDDLNPKNWTLFYHPSNLSPKPMTLTGCGDATPIYVNFEDS